MCVGEWWASLLYAVVAGDVFRNRGRPGVAIDTQRLRKGSLFFRRGQKLETRILVLKETAGAGGEKRRHP